MGRKKQDKSINYKRIYATFGIAFVSKIVEFNLNDIVRMNPNSYCVIMAGGLGNRFWPVSNRRCPKQFSDLLHTGKSFIRQTYERSAQIFPNQRIFIVTGNEYGELTRRQIPELPAENILLEPYVRNTATCIAYAAYKIQGINPDAVMDCGMGLSNIVSRVHSINGTCNVRGAKGKGMHAAVRVNIKGEASAATLTGRRGPRRKKRR